MIFADPFASQLANKFWRLFKLKGLYPAIGEGLRLQNRHFPFVFRQQIGGCETGEAGADHDAAFWIHVTTFVAPAEPPVRSGRRLRAEIRLVTALTRT
jgi:hypothetical protein